MLLVVADGVGGHPGGEVASVEALRALTAYLTRKNTDPGRDLPNAVRCANVAVRERAGAERRLHDMATTLVAAVIRGGHVWVANVGDSRAYLVTPRSIRQLTRDHTLTNSTAAASGASHVLTRSLGAAADVEIDMFGPVRLKPQARLLLCSDGLYRALDNQELSRITLGASADLAVRRLIAAANVRGGPDNISVALCAID
jgi:protein phosphatase